ncbi:carbohydrate binding domain-containing protein [Streptosporangium lutulentum]|uniref:chitinase n=1 Tax=Streptosporangium lutulentum TaxID=1461250 RepID=A0ABT9QGQ7_9ACTN|nr:glycosyl hydrolase family 18 protein [Streptosporangium lutulentum]MDP9845948.1 chitinase [Streptosporangium lutulentum]
MRLRKLAAVAVLALGGTMLAASPAHAANVAVNPGFENDLAGWTCTATSGAAAVSSPVHGGTRALQATPAGNDTARCRQTVSVRPSSSYTLSAWVRGGYVFLGATGTGGTDLSTWTSSPSAYAQLSTTFTTGASTTSVTIYVNGWYGQGVYQADDVVLDGAAGQGQPPATPTGLTGTGNATTASLSWSASAGATAYTVYRNGTRVGTATGTTFSESPGTGTHSYQVSATNASGESARSGAVSVTIGTGQPQLPPVPSGLAATVSGTNVSLRWNASSGATAYNVYRNGTKVAAPTATSYTDTPGAGTHTYQVSASNSAGESARSGQVSATVTTAPPPGDLPKRVLVGYLHASFANGSGYIRMADVPNEWNVINLSFGEPTSVTSGDIRFAQCPVAECPNVESEAEFIAGIRAKQALGKKVLISIGGQNGQVQLSTTAARDKFVQSVSAIIDKYGLDGLDIDFEGHSLYLDNGDTNLASPTTPVIVNLISALKSLKARYGSRFVLTMAPETFFVQLGYQFYGPGPNGSADRRAASYLPVIHAMRGDLTLLHVQDYNSGPIVGLDNQYHTMGNHDFHVAMTDMLLAGFPIAGNPNNVFPALRQDQVAIGLPAAPFAGNGFTTVPEVQKAFDCLAKGTNCGSYRPRGVYPNLRGLMTWSINWDRYNAFEFSRSHRAYLNGLG